ncbi:glycerophosphodiester phosphodiesterase family protein [Halovivax gelatinilyticus]|uniref:glycerophosphodiester phosphodiesterase family protein n=1 Tax=Halovivax gelatinilyticus TaxID=2961597 RepID=UPI0020CA724E|nr:glycerophosphodiester phosphodiesterase family protein [Halovivax gelatinilyticus]
MEWLRERPIAHRGLHAPGRPENSLAAFDAAVAKRYPVELDVRLTEDGVPVVFHDRTLSRLTDRTEPVDAVSWETIRSLRLDGTDERIPRLEAALESIDGRVPVLVECKHAGTPGPVESAVIDRLDRYDGPFAVQSFDPRSLAAIRRRRPDWPRVQLACAFEGRPALPWYQKAAAKRLLGTWYSRPDVVAYEHNALPYWPVSLHRRVGIPVLAWTIRDERDRRRVDPYVDNVIFEEIRP